ncbi:MAG TPA: hypothetical protein VHF92_16750 [Geodermatophilus sp.]|nr:hypothetical protein [Geodermatophilus sp.]
MTRRRVLPRASALLFAVALLAGCGEDAGTGTDTSSSGGSAAGSSAPASESPATDSPATGEDGTSDAPPFPGNAEPDTAEASADALVTVTDIRTGRHEGFDRVVFEVGGTGTPGWDVRYVDQASSQGSGDPVDVAGEAVLQVTLTGAGYPYDTGVEEYAGPDPLPGQGTEVVTEVAFDATFEGTTVAFVGTSTEAPFRVYLLESPTRVVLEVAHPG